VRGDSRCTTGRVPLASFTWDEFEALPQTHWRGDIHCVTKWSKFDTEWSGVAIDDLFAAATSRRRARICWRIPSTNTTPTCRWRTSSAVAR
jgi:hypothetical protein